MTDFALTPDDIARILGHPRESKPADDNVPKIRFDVPKLTGQQIVDSVQHGKPLWRTLQQTAIEDEATRRAKKLSDRYDMTEIPKPIFDDEDWHL